MRCDETCAGSNSAALNRVCGCAVVDISQLRDKLEAMLPASGAVDTGKHAHLFSPYALFVDRSALDAMAAVASAVFHVAENPGYIEHVLRQAPKIARYGPATTGGVLGLDFHLTVEGPRLIEINTNPGGLLLNAFLQDEVRSCAPISWAPWDDGPAAQEAGISAWLDDVRSQLGRIPTRMAIVDTTPSEQFLYPEFQLYARAFSARGVDTVIRAPDELFVGTNGIRDGLGKIDAVYNRLTDFALADTMNAPLANAYLENLIALTPSPRAHALFADKRNLAILGNAGMLKNWGVEAQIAEPLMQAIPPTVEVNGDNRAAMWANRDRFFFKPASGFGSRGSYRGDKLTRRAWEGMATTSYVAQTFTPPSMRVLHENEALKADVRCFASRSGAILFAARLYQGQTTNMRTPRGGFAAVLTMSEHPDG